MNGKLVVVLPQNLTTSYLWKMVDEFRPRLTFCGTISPTKVDPGLGKTCLVALSEHVNEDLSISEAIADRQAAPPDESEQGRPPSGDVQPPEPAPAGAMDDQDDAMYDPSIPAATTNQPDGGKRVYRELYIAIFLVFCLVIPVLIVGRSYGLLPAGIVLAAILGLIAFVYKTFHRHGDVGEGRLARAAGYLLSGSQAPHLEKGN